jgi:hypothetical protein
MKRIKIAEAPPLAIDWLVGKAQGMFTPDSFYPGWRVLQGKLHLLSDSGDVFNVPYCPSTNPAQGHPILDRARVCLMPDRQNGVDIYSAYMSPQLMKHWCVGPTMLIAGLRCFLVSRLGEEAEVPEELLA